MLYILAILTIDAIFHITRLGINDFLIQKSITHFFYLCSNQTIIIIISSKYNNIIFYVV